MEKDNNNNNNINNIIICIPKNNLTILSLLFKEKLRYSILSSNKVANYEPRTSFSSFNLNAACSCAIKSRSLCMSPVIWNRLRATGPLPNVVKSWLTGQLDMNINFQLRPCWSSTMGFIKVPFVISKINIVSGSGEGRNRSPDKNSTSSSLASVASSNAYKSGVALYMSLLYI